MKNALILTGIWLGILLTAYAIVFWDQGIDRPLPISILEQQVEFASGEYVQPEGLFSLTVPVGWNVSEQAEYVRMEEPNGGVSVWMVAVESSEPGSAIEDALNATGAGMLTMTSTEPLPVDAWDGEERVVTYVNEGEVLLVHLQRPEAWTVVMLAQGPEMAVDALTENLNAIWADLAIPAETMQVL